MRDHPQKRGFHHHHSLGEVFGPEDDPSGKEESLKKNEGMLIDDAHDLKMPKID